MENRVFFSESALDTWIVDGTIDLQQSELTILAEGRIYRLAEAVHVLREVSGGGDPHELVGRVKARAHFELLGAEIVESSLLLGNAAYDVQLGWLGVPVGPYGQYLRSEQRKEARAGRAVDDPKSEEDLLARLAAGNL
jgi:hypothetical protein